MSHRIALDTSFIIASLTSWHAHHAECAALLEEEIQAGADVLIPAHALFESYSVLTRLPAPHRLSAPVALELLQAAFQDLARIVGVAPEDTWEALNRVSAKEVLGGTTYDAVILEAALRADAAAILTLNRRHFELVADSEKIQVVSPKA